MSAAAEKPTTKSFLDTSVAYKLQTGTSLHQEYLSKTIPRKWYVNNYVKMEYYRTCLIEWIYLYFESADNLYKTFGDALKSYAEGFGRESKTAINLVSSMELDGYSLAKPTEKEVCRQKLQDTIFEMAFQFREVFTDMGKDPTKCSRVPHPIRFPDGPEDRDEILRKVAWTFDQEEQRRRECSIQNLFQVASYGNKMAKIASASVAGKAKNALDRIQDTITKASAEPSAITCQACGKMGDAVIAAALDSAWKLHSVDLVHRSISEAIDLEFEIHPSDAALRKASKTTEAGTPSSNDSKPAGG